jgi:hypothetical protein
MVQAITPQKVVRGVNTIFEQLFLDEVGDPLVPIDPAQYPSVSIVSPSEEIIQQAVAISLGDGRYRYSWFVPADAELSVTDQNWRIDWILFTAGGRQVSKTQFFTVIDNIVATSEERAYTNLTLENTSERLFLKMAREPSSLSVTLMNTGGQVETYTPVKVNTDGFIMYYADTSELQVGSYIATWAIRETPISPSQHFIQQIRVPESQFWFLQPSLRMLMDKVQKKEGHVQAYSDSDMYEYFVRGLGIVNSFNPITMWGFGTISSMAGIDTFLIAAAAWWGLQAQFIAEGELKFNFSGQTITLDTDRTGTYESAISRLGEYIRTELPKVKRNLLRRNSVGSLATRPYDYGLSSVVVPVFRGPAGTGQILPLLSRIGLL